MDTHKEIRLINFSFWSSISSCTGSTSSIFQSFAEGDFFSSK
jgi:hypothetical protein